MCDFAVSISTTSTIWLFFILFTILLLVILGELKSCKTLENFKIVASNKPKNVLYKILSIVLFCAVTSVHNETKKKRFVDLFYSPKDLDTLLILYWMWIKRFHRYGNPPVSLPAHLSKRKGRFDVKTFTPRIFLGCHQTQVQTFGSKYLSEKKDIQKPKTFIWNTWNNCL